MAIVKAPGQTFILGAGGLGTNTYVLGDGSDSDVSTFCVHVATTTPGTVSIVVKGRSRLIPTGDSAPAFLPIPYLVLTDGGTVAASPPAYSSAALTGSGDLILIPATGLDIALDVTYTDGVHAVYVTKDVGAAA